MTFTFPFLHHSAVSAVESEDDAFIIFDFSKEKYGLVIKKKGEGSLENILFGCSHDRKPQVYLFHTSTCAWCKSVMQQSKLKQNKQTKLALSWTKGHFLASQS